MDNSNFFNNFPSDNYTFQNNSNNATPTLNSTNDPQPMSYIMQPQSYAPQTLSYVSQPTTPGQGFIPSNPSLGPQTPNYVPPPPMPPAFVPPPPPPPVFFVPSIVTPMPIPDTSLENPSEYSGNYSTEYMAQYTTTSSSKFRRYSKKSPIIQKYTPNPSDQPQPTDYSQEYTTQYTSQYATEQPTEYLTETTPEIPSETSFETGPIISDDDIIINFEAKLPIQEIKTKPESISIVKVKEKICHLILMMNIIKDKQNMLKEQVSTLSEEEWTMSMEQIEKSKAQITYTLAEMNDSYLDLVRKQLTKRAAKRLRLKRARLERKRENEERLREWKERSRKIDENLQKIQDDIFKVKMEEEAKLQADEILKDVLKKKSSAKKCIAKLEALVRLRKARKNTAEGRGEKVSAMEETTFNKHIEKLKLLWMNKLVIYDKEESDLRAKLKKESEKQIRLHRGQEEQVLENLAKWKEFLFGGVSTPQVNFQGDVETFIASRCEWDHFLSSEGSPLPIGWVVPPC